MIVSVEKAIEDLTVLCLSPGIRQVVECLGPDADLHLVGGTVRDVLLGQDSTDIDFATKLLPSEIISRLESKNIRVLPTGLKHQTVLAVPTADQAGIEITTFRSSGMSPEGGIVEGKTIEEDLCYRDFTVNAMAFSLNKFNIIDNVQGLSDLQNRILRSVGEPHLRFSEDPLRTMRMVRLATEHQLTIETQTFETAKSFKESLKKVSIERIRDELSKILVSESPDRGLRLLAELGFLAEIIPELAICIGYEQNKFHLYDLFEHTLQVLHKTPADLVLRMSALLHDIGKPQTLSIDPQTGERHFFKHETVGTEISHNILERLRYSNNFITQVTTLVSTHMRPLESGPPGLRRLLRDTGDLFPLWRILKEADASSCKIDHSELKKRLDNFDNAIEEVKRGPDVSPLKMLALNGNDLKELGYKQGPEIGTLLRLLHEKVLDNPELNKKEILISLVKHLSVP